MMAVVLTAVTVLTASPGAGHATPAVPQITEASAEVNSNNTAVTVTFNTYAQPAGSLADLMDDIQIERSDSEQWVDLAADSASNAISMNTDGALVITLGTALTGTGNNLQIAAGAVMNEEGLLSANVITVSSIAANDITAPVFTGSRSNDGSWVNLYFDEDFSLNLPDEATEEQADTFLASRISVAGDGEHFVPFTNNEGSAYQNNSRELYLNYDNDMTIISGTDTVIRIAGGTLKDAAGNLNAEMNVHVSPPVIQSAVVSNDNHDVVITFNKDIVNNTSSDDNLKSNIYLVRTVSGQEKSFKALVAQDTLSIESNKLHIHFAEALSGTESQIVIGSGVLKDLNGNLWDQDTVSGFLETAVGGVDPSPADTTMPAYLYYSVSDDYQDITFVFDEDIYNAMGNDSSFLQNVQWYDPFRNQWIYTLPSDVTVTFSGSKFTMHFPVPLTGSQYYYQFNSGHFKDAAGNVLTDYVTTNWINPQNPAAGISYNGGYFSGDGRFLSLAFNTSTALTDQTLIDGVSHLSEYITISTDYGLTYSALDPLDVVSLQGSQIAIIFHNAKQQGSVKVKVAPGVLSDLYDTKRNSAVEATIAYNTPELTGYFFSNTDTGTRYTVTVDAEGYSSKYFEGQAYKSSEVFYMTAPVVTGDNGITASIRLLNNAYDDEVNGNQTIIFELFDGTSPVSIVAANLKVDTGTYSANFNVGDAAVNPNYTVKAYVVSRYGNDPVNLGLNLATVKTPPELDLAMLAANQNNYND
ncbi:hypothetical protein KC345_g8901 [Hortaea werneckii]|nr:hypothetical protein KC345_g8901 [Hortaea werneckii]